MSDLDDLLPGDETVETPETEETAQTEEATESEEQVEPEKEEPKKPETVPLAAHIEQRKEFQAKLDAIQSKLDEMTKPEPVKAPEFLDPEGSQFFQQQMAQMQAHFSAELSETKARAKFGDDHIDEAIQAATQAGVVDQFKGQPDAWGKLGAWHKQQKVVSEIGDDPAAYKEKLRAELLQEIKSELAAEQVKTAAGQPAPSLANVQGTGNAARPKWGGPKPLDDILG